MKRKQWQHNWRKLLAWSVKCVIYCMYSDLSKLFELSFSIWAHKVCSVFLETMTRCHVTPVMWIKSFVQQTFFTTDIWTSYLLVTSHSKESTTVTNNEICQFYYNFNNQIITTIFNFFLHFIPIKMEMIFNLFKTSASLHTTHFLVQTHIITRVTECLKLIWNFSL